MSQAGSHDGDLDPEQGDPAPPDPRRRLTFVIVLTVVVVGLALLVAVWMYWLAGTLPA